MKATELAKIIMGSVAAHGDYDVYVQAEFNGARSEQKAFDIWWGNNQVILVSKEAMDADPLLALPTISADDAPLSEPH